MIRYCVDIFVLDLSILCLQERLTDFKNIFSPKNFKKDDDIILNYFMTNVQKCLILMKHLVCIPI